MVIRRMVLTQGLAWLGVAVDDRGGEEYGFGGDRETTGASSRVRTFVISAREDLQLAAEAERMLAGG